MVSNEQVWSYLSKSNQDIEYVRVVVEHGSFFHVCVELRLGLTLPFKCCRYKGMRIVEKERVPVSHVTKTIKRS